MDKVIDLFSNNVQSYLNRLTINEKKHISEIRLKIGKPLVLNFSDGDFLFINIYYSTAKTVNRNTLLVKKEDIDETFNKMCNYSIYSFQNEIKNGFITLKGGYRVGICGTAVFDGQTISNIKNISSINVRIPYEIMNADLENNNVLVDEFKGMLVVGPPCSGKTTLLRYFSKIFSSVRNNKLMQVSVVDERGELSGTYKGVSQNDLGFSDVLNCYKKSIGINHAIRALNPDIIVCDEIFKEDISAIKYGVNSGVKFIASMHANNEMELLRKPYINELLKINAFDKFIFLCGKNNPSKIKKVLNFNELLTLERLIC